MRTIAFAALLLIGVPVLEAVQDSREGFSDSVERAFAPGRTVWLDLAAGDCRVTRGDDRRIRINWHTRTADQLREARVRLDVRGDEAEIVTWGPKGRNNHFRVDIELPRRSDLHLRMSAGDLFIGGIEGHKDVRLRAGDLSIEVPDPSEYREVRASVTAGDLSAQPFGFTTGGLFRSFKHEGKGRYNLHVRLWAGDLVLTPARAAAQ